MYHVGLGGNTIEIKGKVVDVSMKRKSKDETIQRTRVFVPRQITLARTHACIEKPTSNGSVLSSSASLVHV